MMKTFVLTQVVPNIRGRVPDSCALVLGKAFLWFLYRNDTAGFFSVADEEFKTAIKTELNEILTASGIDVGQENYNPIRRVPVVVSEDQGSVFIDAIFEEEQVGAAGGVGGGAVVAGGGGVVVARAGAGARGPAEMNAQMIALHSLSTQIRREVHEMKLAQVGDWTWMQRTFGIVNTNMRRLEVTAALGRRVVGGNVGNAGNDDANIAATGLQHLARAAHASLSPCPRSLYDLWTEYVHGIGGRKPASQFSHGERGKSKHKDFRHNVV